MSDPQNEEYLGDGVYAVFDGWLISLLANDRNNPTDTVHLEPEVLNNLNMFASKCFKREEK